MKRFGKALVFGILCLILTFAITVQLRVSSLSESESSQTKITDKLKDEIFRLNDENVKLAEKFQNTTSELDDARNQAAQNDSSSKDTSELIKKYTIVSGKTDVTGQGIIIKYKPSDNEAKADMVKDLRDIVNEIKNAGAEAIEINNQRIVGTTAIEMVKNKIEINDTENILVEIIDTRREIDNLSDAELKELEKKLEQYDKDSWQYAEYLEKFKHITLFFLHRRACPKG